MADVLHLYGFGDSDRSSKVRWTAAELGIPVEERRVAFPDHRKPPYLDKNPLGAIPTVEWRGRTMGESSAICTWLAETEGSSLVVPAGDSRRADYLWWVAASTESCEGPLVQCAVSKGGLLPPTYLEQQAPMVKHKVRAIAERLPAEGYLLGDFTLADIFVAYSMRLALSVGLLDEVGPWYERLQARPAAQQARFF